VAAVSLPMEAVVVGGVAGIHIAEPQSYEPENPRCCQFTWGFLLQPTCPSAQCLFRV
jgi:hypothetical protein